MSINEALVNKNWISVPAEGSDEHKRFKLGKLVMLSPKHKAIMEDYRRRMGVHVYVKTSATKSIPTELGYVEPQNWAIKATGELKVGIPFLVLTDPYRVDNRILKDEINRRVALSNSMKHTNFAAKNPVPELPRYFHANHTVHWVMEVAMNGDVYALIVPNKVWRHYLCLVVPRRAKKYGIE